MGTVYDRNILEFAATALEFCTWMEREGTSGRACFVDRAVKLLPLLYLKTSCLPDTSESDDEGAHFITEQTYELVRTRIAGLLGEYDSFLDTFSPDMPYSDTPVTAFISENLADIYQALGNFVYLFRQGHEDTMFQALSACTAAFRQYWGQSLLNALKALHAIRYDDDI
ncbi:MAG: DUF5063 domain-containing protein [Tannerella sp.]|jgi:hypothetical protein|nr:DUF5063 domain-containing protein [Tannerella sp.]